MEASLKHLKELFGLKDKDIRTYSPLTLAYIGDAIYELIIRSVLVEKGNMQVNKLHQRASRLVKASAQSAIIEKLKDSLTEEEMAVYKRGRNTNIATVSKHVDVVEYKKATGFECLIGYLYVTKNNNRLDEIVKKCIDFFE